MGSESAVFSKHAKNSLTPYIGTLVPDNCCKGVSGTPKNVKRGFYEHLFFGTNFKEILGIYLPNFSEPLCANAWEKIPREMYSPETERILNGSG